MQCRFGKKYGAGRIQSGAQRPSEDAVFKRRIVCNQVFLFRQLVQLINKVLCQTVIGVEGKDPLRFNVIDSEIPLVGMIVESPLDEPNGLENC